MNKSKINVPSAGTDVDSNSTVQNQQVGQPNANTHVGSSRGKVVINIVNGERRVYFNQKLVGTLRKFCCGIDFRPKECPDALFSILSVRFGDYRLMKCLEALCSIKIPNKSFHWNFSYKTAKNDCKMEAFAVALKKLK